MSAIEFIKLKLKKLSGKFQDARFRYQYDETTGDHLIEVTPNDIFSNSEEYAFAESEIIKEFVKIYQSESVIFFSDKSYIKLNEEGIIYSPASWFKTLRKSRVSSFNMEEFLKEVVKEKEDEYTYRLAA